MFIIFIVFTMSAISFKFQWKNSVTETETIMIFKSEKFILWRLFIKFWIILSKHYVFLNKIIFSRAYMGYSLSQNFCLANQLYGSFYFTSLILFRRGFW